MTKRIVCWVGDAPNHRALVNKIAASFNLVGVVVDTKKALVTKTKESFLVKLLNRIRFGRIDKAWASLQQYYRQKFPGWPGVPVLRVDTVNKKEVLDFTSELQPDLVVVSGTSLVKEPLVSMTLPIGIMNLHTGLSPYVKGGPNCTNWCIANGQWELIGNTIMWLSSGIDSGNIITSERTELVDSDDLNVIHRKVMEHAHDLYLRAIKYVLTANTPYQSIAQSTLGKGNLYLTRMWNSERKRLLLHNMRATRNSTGSEKIHTVPLPG
jgi:methionyl-tRNA formyltransferase